MKIRAKISLSMIGLYAVTALITGAAVFTFARTTVETQSANALKAVAESLMESFTAYMENAAQYLGGYLDTEDLIQAAGSRADASAVTEARMTIRSLLESSPQLEDIYISRGGAILVSGRGLVSRAPDSGVAFLPAPAGRPCIVVHRPLRGTGAELGFILSMDYFRARYASRMKISPRASLLIVDPAAERLLMHTDPAVMSVPSPGLRGFLKRSGSVPTGLLYYRAGREDKVAYLLPAGPYIYGVTLFRSDLLADLYAAYRYLGLISILSAAAFVLLALLVARGISRPALHLSEAARQIASRNYQVRVNLRSGDEMELLGRAFNQMADVIQASTANLETQVAERTAELEEKVRQIQELSVTDALTGIYNRKRFSEELAAEILRARRYESSFALIMFDIDHFKAINDGHGHDVGDAVLVELTALVRRGIRVTDLFARWGGEEFMVLLPQTDLGGAESMAEKLRQEVEAHSFPGVARVTCSFGVAAFTDIDDQPVLLKRADEALYEAKETGRNRVVVA